jgi:hypothetical protein
MQGKRIAADTLQIGTPNYISLQNIAKSTYIVCIMNGEQEWITTKKIVVE